MSFDSWVYIFIKKETLAQMFSFEFLENFKNIRFTEHLHATASVSISDMLTLLFYKSNKKLCFACATW